MSKILDEHFKLVHELIDLADRLKRKICVIVLWYNVEKPESWYVEVRIFAGKKEDENLQQIVVGNYELEIIYLLDVKNSVYDKVTTNEPIGSVL